MPKTPDGIPASPTGAAFATSAVIGWLYQHPQQLRKAASFDYVDELSEWFLTTLDDAGGRLRFTEVGNSLAELKQLIGADLDGINWSAISSAVGDST